LKKLSVLKIFSTRHAEMVFEDSSCKHTIYAAKDHILKVLRNRFCFIFGTANCTRDVMRSKPDHELDLKQGLLSGGFLQSRNKGAPEIRNSKICDVKCNSLLQLKQHGEGHQQHARLVSEDVQEKIKWTHLPKNQEKFCPSSCYIQPRVVGGRGMKLKFPSGGHMEKKTLIWCELCDITFNGNSQYLSHIQGKEHQMAAEELADML